MTILSSQQLLVDLYAKQKIITADDFGRYRFNESIEYVRQRSRDKHRPVHADGLSMFILSTFYSRPISRCGKGIHKY